MRENHVISSVQKGFNTVSVAFEMKPNSDSQTWTYKAPDQLQVLKGDKVVVQANNSFKVGTVMEVHDEPQINLDSNYDYKWIIDKVDFALFEAITKSEEEFTKSLRKMRTQSANQQVINALAEQYAGTPEQVKEQIELLLDVSKIQSGVAQLENRSE